MIFEVGKFYRNEETEKEVSILCRAHTTFSGDCLIVETNDGQRIEAMPENEESSINYVEIPKKEWMKNVDWNSKYYVRRTK